MRLWKAYQRLLQSRPIVTQGITSGFIFGLSDVIAQQVVERRTLKGHDYVRTSRQTFFGLVITGPALITWYKFLSRTISSTGKLMPIKKVLLDQFVFTPVFLTTFFVYVLVTTGNDAKQIKKSLTTDVPQAYITGMKIWPAVQLCNFYLLPVHFQPILVNCVALFWNTYLSWKANRDKTSEKEL